MCFLLSLGRIRFDLLHVRVKGLTLFVSAMTFKVFEIYTCYLSNFLTEIVHEEHEPEIQDSPHE